MYVTRKLVRNVLPFACKRRLSTKTFPTSAEIVIAGGGIIGTSIAYHLAELGWKDILILEQGTPGCGTSWHAAGNVISLRGNYIDTQNVLYGQRLFQQFEKEYGVGYKKCGSLSLAQTDERAKFLRRMEVMVNGFGGECYLVSPEEAQRLNPHIQINDIKLGLFSPNDNVVNPTDCINAFLNGAKKNGSTRLLEGVEVEKVGCEGRRVTQVQTNKGSIKCDFFVNSTGLWARELGQKSDIPVQVPLHACQHFYIVTKPCGVDSMMPITRDYDSFVYTREWSGGFLTGGFEPKPLPCFHDNIPEKFEFQLLDENWEQFMPLMEGISNRYPLIETAEVRSFVNGPESFTPDYHPHISQSMELDNYYIAAGMTSFGIAFSGGTGRVLAELITYGESPNYDPYTADIRRLEPGCNNKRRCRTGALNTLENTFLLKYPDKCYVSPRNILTSSVHTHLTEHGAVWIKDYGWEIPTYFKEETLDDFPGSFGRPAWLQNVQNEIKAAKTSIGIVDLSSQSVFKLMELSDGSLLDLLEEVLPLDNVNALKAGKTSMVTPVINKHGRCVAVATLNKISDSILLTTDPVSHNYLNTMLEELLHKDKLSKRVILQNVTDAYGCFGVVGPKTRSLLESLIPPPDNGMVKHLEGCEVLDVGYASNVIIFPAAFGDGFHLLIPTNQCQGLYQELMTEGGSYGLRNIGHYAWDSLRVQKGIGKVPNEIGLNTPSELMKQYSTEEGLPNIKLLKIEIAEDEIWPIGGEEIIHTKTVTQQTLGEITSIGYDEGKLDEVYAMVDFRIEVGEKDVLVKTASGNFKTKFIS